MKPPTQIERAARSIFGCTLVTLAVSTGSALAGPLQEPVPGGDPEIRRVGPEVESCLDVRARPSYRSPVIDCLESGRQVAVARQEGGWTRVIFDGDLTGWVSSRFLVAVDAPAPAAAVEPATVEAPTEPEPPVTGAGGPGAEQLDPVATELLGLSERLRLAEARAATLEGELAAVREAQAATVAEAASLEAQVRELTEERNDLARQLARTEGRLLYVIGDLERTRAELMSLKGIPPKLVPPEQEPAPAAPPPEPEPEPEPEPVESAASELLEPSIDPDRRHIDAVLGTVRAWARAWAAQRADDYLAFYSSSFTPPDGESREEWAARRRERVLAPRSIEITLDRLSPIIQGDRARVMFVQTYVSDTFSDTVDKTLVLERIAESTWQIVEEYAE